MTMLERLERKNALALIGLFFGNEEKNYETLAPLVNVMKRLLPSLTKRPNKLALGKYLQPSHIFTSNARALPNGASEPRTGKARHGQTL